MSAGSEIARDLAYYGLSLGGLGFRRETLVRDAIHSGTHHSLDILHLHRHLGADEVIIIEDV